MPPGGLHSPYPDYAKLAKDDGSRQEFRLPGCNECHGGGGGGGMCPALSQGIWFWGNTDDVLFRLVTLGSAELEKSGFVRYQCGSVHAPMPPMGVSIKTSDELWKIIAFIRSINPPGTNPPEKVIPGKLREGDAPHNGNCPSHDSRAGQRECDALSPNAPAPNLGYYVRLTSSSRGVSRGS